MANIGRLSIWSSCLFLRAVAFNATLRCSTTAQSEEVELRPRSSYRRVGLVVKASASRVADPEFDSCLRRGNYSGSSHTSDLEIGTPVATLPCTWRYRVCTGTCRRGVSIL